METEVKWAMNIFYSDLYEGMGISTQYVVMSFMIESQREYWAGMNSYRRPIKWEVAKKMNTGDIVIRSREPINGN